MDPELTKLESLFNKRIEEWITKQGLLFQFAHNTGNGSIYPKIYGLFVRLLILGVIGMVAFWFYLISRPNSIAYKEDIQRQLEMGLNASEVKISNISRDKGGLLTSKMLVAAITLGETKSSFFEDWYLKEEEVSVVGRRSVVEKKNLATIEGIQLSPLGIGDNFLSGWSGKELEIMKIELKLKVGAETDELALASYLSLFKEYETLKVGSIQVYDANLMWGYSDATDGSIKGAQLKVLRGNDSWEISVKGGRFSHGWLKDAEILDMKVICHRSGEVVIESAKFKIGDGELTLNAAIQIQSQPELSGTYAFENVEVLDLISEKYEEWVGGKIHGTGELSGKLNSKEGIKTITTVVLNGSSEGEIKDFSKFDSEEEKMDSVIILRGDNFQLLKVIQISDLRNSYSRLRAYRGTLVIENQGMNSQITVNDVRFGSNELILMRGKFDYAPSLEEQQNEKIDTSSLELSDVEAEPIEELAKDDEDVSMKVAPRVFSGDLEMGIIPDVFESNAKVFEHYPVDSETIRVWFNIKMEGQFEQLTYELGELLFEIMEEEENK